MGGHHLILGKLTDYISGHTLADTHDERARQSIARFLVQEKGFAKSDFRRHLQLPVTVDGDTGEVMVDYLVHLQGQSVMVVVYGPGAIVSRQRATLAIARLLEPVVIPYAVISNGQEAIVMESASGRVIGKTMDVIFSRTELLAVVARQNPVELPEDRREKEERILFCMEVLTARECEAYTCNRC